MRRGVLLTILCSLLLGLFVASPLRSDFLFWLDGPAYRSNPNDAQSPWYRSPTPVPFSPTASPTASPTSMDSATVTPSITETSTSTPTPTETATDSPSPTATPSPTFSITPFVFYDGDSPSASFSTGARVTMIVTPGGVPGGTTILSALETSSGGAAEGSFMARINMRTLGVPILGGIALSGSASVDVSAYPALSLWMRSIDGCFDPVVMIHSPGGTLDTNTSVAVTATAYTVDGGALDAGVWRHVVIPLSAFDGVNLWGNPYSLSANLNQIDWVAVMPSWPRNFFYASGFGYWVFRAIPPTAYQATTMDLDKIHFEAPNLLPASNRVSAVFDTFVSPDSWTHWGTQWAAFSDSWTCGTINTSITYPSGTTEPSDGSYVGPFNACYVGHIAGVLGDAAGAGVGTCTTEFSYAGMQADFDAGGLPVNLDTLPGLPLTAGKVTGIQVSFKRLTPSASVDYALILRKASVAALNDGAHYRHVFTAAQLPYNSWVTFNIPFPPTGLPGTDTANSFGQPSWAAGASASVNWDASDLLSMQIVPDDTARGQAFDILVGQIKFY